MRRFISFVLAVLCAFSVAGCTKKPTVYEDVLTQKSPLAGRTQITMMVKHAFSLNTFERAVEEEYPDIDLVLVGNFSVDMGKIEYETRLKNDDLTDIICTWPLNVGKQYWADRLMDLSNFPCSGKYKTRALDAISKEQNGALYYLPGPTQVRGIVYNKTLFEENEWSVPSDYDGFISLCQKIEATDFDGKNMRALQLGFANSEVFNTAFVGYGYNDCFSTPAMSAAIEAYNNGEGQFANIFSKALDTFEHMSESGIFKPSDLTINYSQRETMLFSRKCAMIEDSVLMCRMGQAATGSKDKFALMPFFNPPDHNGAANKDYARTYDVSFIGVNKHLEEKQNKKKLDLVKKLLDYMSTPEGQTALAGDTGAMFSYLNGAESSDIPEIEDLTDALTSGRYSEFPVLKNAQRTLEEGLAALLKGEKTKEQVAADVDAANLNPEPIAPSRKIGTAEADFSQIEMGSFFSDVMREKVGADIGLFIDNGKDGRFTGKGLTGRFYKGDLTENDLFRIFPGLKNGERGVLQKVSMTGENLIKTLEYGVPVDQIETGLFYYFSGLKMEFSPIEAPGKRIKKITDTDGNPIDPTRVYTLAVMDQIVPDAYATLLEDTGLKILDIIRQDIESKGTIRPAADKRFTVIM